MADERLLTGILRFWDRAQIEAAYQQVLQAYGNTVIKEVTIIGTNFDGQNTNAQYTLNREAMAVWMDVLEAALQAKDDEAAGSAPLVTGSPTVDFSQRRVGT